MEPNSLEPFQAQCLPFTIWFNTEKYDTYFHNVQDTIRFYDKRSCFLNSVSFTLQMTYIFYEIKNESLNIILEVEDVCPSLRMRQVF
jgi:hypothetical protein